MVVCLYFFFFFLSSFEKEPKKRNLPAVFGVPDPVHANAFLAELQRRFKQRQIDPKEEVAFVCILLVYVCDEVNLELMRYYLHSKLWTTLVNHTHINAPFCAEQSFADILFFSFFFFTANLY